MIIKSIKLKEIDDKAPYGYPKKSIEIKTREGEILTPSRVITNHEYNQKEIVPTDITLDPKVSIFVERFGYNKLQSFLTEDSPFERLFDRLRVQKERAQNSLINLALLKPTTTEDDDGRSSLDILKIPSKREKFYRTTIQAQKIVGFDPIAVAIPDLSMEDAKSMMKETKKEIEKDDHSCMFFLEPGKKFPTLLDYAIKDLDLQLIGVNYKRYTKAVHSYEAMRSYYDKDVAFLIANTKREDGYFDDLSTMHYMPFLSNDLFASFVPSPSFGGNENLTPAQKLGSARLFNTRNLTVKKILESSFDPDELLNEVGRPKESTLRDMLLNFEEAGRSKDNVRLNRLKAFTKVHEAKTSLIEFNVLRKHIKDRTTKDYVEEGNNKILKAAVSRIR